MSKLALIGTFYQRHHRTQELLHRVFEESSLVPDEVWLMCEGEDDYDALGDYREYGMVLSTPLNEDGSYAVIPYSNKINHALDLSDADLFVYLDNGSTPGIDKYRVMKQALDRNPEWGAVWCTQKRTGFAPMVVKADRVVHNAYSVLNYTQVMHRRCEARWTLDMQFANPDLADAMFWADLHKEFGPFHPAGGPATHDYHHIPSPAAVGV